MKKDFYTEFTKHVVNYYDEVLIKEIRIQEHRIKDIFESVVQSKKELFPNLTYKNDVYTGDYFFYTSRSKSASSIEEKLFRKSELLYSLFEILPLGSQSIDYDYEFNLKLKEKLFLFEDIIGIRYITELNRDAQSIFELIEDSYELLKKQGITFLNLDKPIKEMKNGLKIYNIKGYFEYDFIGPIQFGYEVKKIRIGIELQIKSQLETAWGDLEHKSFYKNHIISPVTGISKTSVNHIGRLLNEIDQFLYSVRNSEKNYREEKDTIFFKEILNEVFLPEAKTRIHAQYNLHNYNNLIASFFHTQLPSLDLALFSTLTQDLVSTNWDYIQEGINHVDMIDDLKMKSLHLEFIEVIFFTLKKNQVNSDFTWNSQEFLLLLWKSIYQLYLTSDTSEEEKMEIFSNKLYEELEPYFKVMKLNEQKLIDSNSYSILISIFNSVYDDLISEAEDVGLSFIQDSEVPTDKEVAEHLFNLSILLNFISAEDVPFNYSLDNQNLVKAIDSRLKQIKFGNDDPINFINNFNKKIKTYNERIDSE